MAAHVYTVLYTHQKTKKAKVWQDGILKTSEGQQAALYSDKGQRLENVYLKTGMVNTGDELESDRYLITVEAVGDNSSSTKSFIENKDVQNVNRGALKPSGLRPPAGLKRKFTGFQGPREITKKSFVEVDETAALSSPYLAHGRSSQSPQLFATSPLFAASYGKQLDKDKQINSSSELNIVTNPNVRGTTFSSNFSASPERTVTKENLDRVVQGESSKQNSRSTAQILALLNINTLPSQNGSVTDQLPAIGPTVCSNEVLTTTSMRKAQGGSEPCNLPNELSPVRTNPVRSRWDVYLDTPPASGPDQSDQDGFIVPLSPSKRLDISHTSCLIDIEAIQEKPQERDRETDIVEHKTRSDPHISELGLTASQSLPPEILSVDDFIADDRNNERAFAEISFNLMDSFDFTELDDSDSTEGQTDSTKACADFLQEKSQAKHDDNEHVENTLLHENITECDIVTVSELCDKAESKSTIQTILKGQSKTGDNDIKAEVMVESSVIQTVEKGEFLFPNTAREALIPSRRFMFQTDEMSMQQALPKNLADSSGYLRGNSPNFLLPNAIMHHSVQGSNEDCNIPELESSILLLKSLAEPSNALESLTVLTVMSTTKNADNGTQTYLERVEEQALYRLSQKEMPMAASKDYQGTPLFIAEPRFSPVFNSACSPPPVPQHLKAPTVEFQGYRGKGSASSAVVLRHDKPMLDCTTSPGRSPYTQSTSSLTASPSCILGDSIMPVSDNTTQEEKLFITNVCSKSGSKHSAAFCDVSFTQHCLPQWRVGTPGLDCDWELSQCSSSKSDKEKTPTQNPSKNVQPFFLRPRQGNVADHSPVQLHESAVSLEQNSLDFLDSTKILKVQSRLVKELTTISVPENEVDDSACNTPEALKPSTFLLRNDRSDVSPEIQLSKWTMYQSISSEGSQSVKKEDSDFCPQSIFRRQRGTDEIPGRDEEPTTSTNLAPLEDRLGYNTLNDTGSRGQILSKILTAPKHFLPLVGKKILHSRDTGDERILLSCELGFPCRQTVLSSSVPKRKVNIPALFKSPAHYKQVFNACLAEHLNIIMYELSHRLHKAFSKVDMSFYTSSEDETHRKDNAAPFCQHQQPAKLVMVRKEGPNKGRFFYACDATKAGQCKFFKWLDEENGTHTARDIQKSRMVIADMKSLSSYVRCQNINLYGESQLIIRKMSTFPRRQYGKLVKFASVDSEFGGESKTKLYLKLSRKDRSSTYSKDDLWVVSKTLNFDPLDTFIAFSVFFGPFANNDIEISPLKGYSPSNWPSNMVVHALLVCNASTELTSLRNIQEHFNPSSLPIMPHLLTMSSESEKPIKVQRGKFNPPSITAKVSSRCNIEDRTFVLNLAREMITEFCLNEGQASALLQIAHMMAISDPFQGLQSTPITIIHGVFGAGKSYLLAVVVLFLVHLFETHNPPEEHGSVHWKLLISSSTNVAVDRVLLGLLELGFDRFIRVGCIRKIAKPILPHSLHAGSENESEQLKELQALIKEDLTPGEKSYVRKSIELHKLGTNKTLLGQIRVVGATCAACLFPCLSNLKFQVVVLDECSQMTEPASLLPIARFQCEKLILVGDPKQLSPTIQGSEAAHEYGLEQTLFNRLCLMIIFHENLITKSQCKGSRGTHSWLVVLYVEGFFNPKYNEQDPQHSSIILGHQAVMLRTQYRCHPSISAITDELFYEGNLINGVSDEDRKPLLDWLPTLCFYNANGTEEVEGSNSFHNVEEANFTVKLIQSLIASGIEGSMIGVITLYKSQMNKICCLLSSAAVCDPSDMKAVQVSTVDAFQGAEKEIIILSCVRTRQVGFIDSEKRMNVALTRGKRHLLIVGSLACLRKNKMWEQVIHHCEKHKDGLKHVSQWDERLNAILALYQEKKEEEAASSTQRKHIKTKAGKI